MIARIEAEEQAPGATTIFDALGPRAPHAVAQPVASAELETSLLPQDHPPWVRDALSVSNRAKDVIARLKPIAVRVLTYWDHRIRNIFVGGARVSIDPSGCYRSE